MRRAWFSFATSLALASAVGAATILERSVSVVLADSGVREKHRLRVRLETAVDLDAWGEYAIYLNTDRRLGSVTASAVLPDGRRVKVRRRDRDQVEYSGAGVLHSSASLEVLSFPGLVKGAVLEIDYLVMIEPYFPADRIVLRGGEPIERLDVRVTGGGDAWRWRLDGPAEGLEVEETVGGVRITGVDLEKVDPPEMAPGGSAVVPVLRYAWKREGSWRDVGAWYTDLLTGVARDDEAVRAEARGLVDGVEDRREQLEAILAYMREKVRYEAVEIGIGGFSPTPPAEVLERKWGDCKDKGLLLIDLLREVGIESHPALIHAGKDQSIDSEFPSPWQFNHFIVAVPIADLEVEAEDPVAEGFLFLDPTQTRGTGLWLHLSDQDQTVLVVHDGTGTLVRTPIRGGLELRHLVVNLHVRDDGDATGGAGLRLQGWGATRFLEQISGAPPERTEEDARAIFGYLLPGVEITAVGWNVESGGVPAVSLSAAVKVEGLVQGLGQRPSLRLVGLRSTPEPGILKEREEPVVLNPRATEMKWHLSLPEGWCRPAATEREVKNDVGLFRQTIRHSETSNSFDVERRVELRRRWIEPEDVPALYELALAEHRTNRRRIRLECEEATAPSPPTRK